LALQARGNKWSIANLPTDSLKRPIHAWTPTLSDRSVTDTAADGSCLHLSSGSWWPELPSSHLAITCQPRRARRLTPPPGRVREHPAALLRGRHLSTDNQWKKEGAITPAKVHRERAAREVISAAPTLASSCMSSEHFGQLAWQFKRVSGSSGLKVQAAIAC
jgi:hypothetical protein